MIEIASALEHFIAAAAGSHPWILAALAIVGGLRLINKPLFALFRQIVLITPSKDDDLFLDRVEHSKTYLAFCFVLDWIGSVKIGDRKK